MEGKMRTTSKLVAAAALALALVSGSATSVAGATIPWYAWTGYYTGGVLTGETLYYCNGDIRDRGNVFSYDEAVYEHYYDCP
jgi:hypothetical protein